MKNLYFFPDTNLFIQCKPIEEWDWTSLLGDFEVIDIIVTRPIQKEIDAHKNKGNGRVASRSRRAATLLNRVIESDLNYEEIRESAPRVRLYVRLDLKQDAKLDGDLNYKEADDQFVGIVAGFRNDAPPNSGVTLATLDVGPKASAKKIGIPFVKIPDSWLLPPEEDKTAKDLKRVMQELERVKSAEPVFSLDWRDGTVSLKSINATIKCYSPLKPYEVSSFMEKIKKGCPMRTDFGSSEGVKRRPKPSKPSGVMGDVNSLGKMSGLSFDNLSRYRTYAPASAREITQYKKSYEQWLQGCENFLKNLHTHLSTYMWPQLSVELKNTGTRSAEKVLVTFVANGNFYIFPTEKSEPIANGVTDFVGSPKFTLPPKAPQGSWENQFSKMLHSIGHTTDLLNPASYLSDGLIDNIRLPRAREDDAFYYKSGRPSEPVSQYALECALWRHQSPTEIFDLTLHTDMAPADISGGVEVTVQACNLSDNFTKLLPVCIEIQSASTLECADQLVKDLILKSYAP